MSERIILKLLDRPIAFQRSLVDLFGEDRDAPLAALMLSQAIYWSNRTSDKDGWFWKTREEWQEETGLKRAAQEAARKLLRDAGFWAEALKGVPARLYFCLDVETLQTRLLEVNKLVGANSTNQLAVVQPTSWRQLNQQVGARTTNITSSESTSETSTDSISENTAETTASDAPEDVNLKANFKTFQGVFKQVAGRTPEPFHRDVELYERRCSKYGETQVLEALPEWVETQGGKKLTRKNKWAASNFLREAEDILDARIEEKAEGKPKKDYPILKAPWET